MLFASKEKKFKQQNGIVMSTTQHQTHKETAATICSQVLLILLAVFGVTYSVIGSFCLNVSSDTIPAYIILFASIFVFAFYNKKWTKFILPPILLLFCAIGWYYRYMIAQGFILTTNTIFAAFTEHSNWVFDIYNVNITAWQYQQTGTIFLLFVVFAITGLVSYAIIRYRSIFIVFFITFPFIFAALFFMITPPLLPLLMLVSCWIALLVQQVSFHKIKKEKKRNQTTDLSEAKTNPAAHQLNFFIVPAVALCFALILCMFPQSSYVRDTKVDDARAKFQDFAINGNVFSAWQAGGINAGNLKSSGDISFTGEPALKIKVNTNTQMYLRGFAGSTYTGDKWEPIPDEIYNQSSSAFSTLNGKSFNPQNLLEKYIELIQKVPTSIAELTPKIPYNISVKNVHANKHYVYAPYGLITTPADLPDAVFANDGFIKASSWLGLSDYSLNAYNTDNFSSRLNFTMEDSSNIRNYYKTDTRNQTIYGFVPWEQEYLNVEYAYRNFLYDYNTAVPKELKEKILKLCNDNNLVSNNVQDEITAVQTYLATNCRYTLSPGKTPANRDFADYFLFQNHKGYCVHFATAATLILRTMGIPARYVEGYFANNNDLTTLDSDGYATIKDSRAHAWVEVYSMYSGWIPVEMTPSFNGLNGTLSPRAGEVTPTYPEDGSSTPSSSKSPSSTVSSKPTGSSSAATSSLASQSSSSQASTIGKADGPTSISVFSSAMLPIVLIFIILAALLAFVLGNRQYAIRWRKRNFHLQNTNQSVINIYAYLLKFFAFFDYKYQHDGSMQNYAKQAGNVLPFLHGNEFEVITHIAQKASFSQHKITDQELAHMNEFAQSMINPVYHTLPWHKKLLFRYFYRLN